MRGRSTIPRSRLGPALVALALLTACGTPASGPVAGPTAAAPPVAASVTPAAPADAASVPLDVAVATVAADRQASSMPGADCDLSVVRALAARHPEAGQWIVTRTASWAATSGVLDVAVRSADGTWRCQRPGQAAMVGRSGTRPLIERRSGGGTAPAGVFPLGTATAWDGTTFQFFGNGADPGVRGAYRAVQMGDCWGATPGAATYNHLYRNTRCTTGDDEYLPSITGAYVHVALIGANGEPDVSGDAPGEPPYAAAIFLHRHAYVGPNPKPTSGCVSLAIDDLVATLDLIDPSLTPRFAIGPTDWLASTA